MFFVLPKSKHGSYRLYALWLPQYQNPGTFQILLHSCLSLFHRMTVWLTSCLSIHCLQAFPHSRACIPPASGTLFLPQVVQCPLSPFPSEWPPQVSSLSSCSPSLSQTYLNTLDLNWEDWDILNDFINLFSQRWAVQLLLEVRDMLPRGSNYCFLVEWSQNQAIRAQGCL